MSKKHEFIRNEYTFDVRILFRDHDSAGNEIISSAQSFDSEMPKELVLEVLENLDFPGHPGKAVSVNILKRPLTVYKDKTKVSVNLYQFSGMEYNSENVKTESDLKKAILETSAFLDSVPEEQSKRIVPYSSIYD